MCKSKQKWIKLLLISLVSIQFVGTSAFSTETPAPEPEIMVNLVQMAAGALTTVRRNINDVRNCPTENGIYFADRQSVDRYRQILAGQRRFIEADQADRVFRYLAQQTHIPFHFPEDGCYARAHEMAQLLELNGIYSRKVFLENNDHYLHVNTEWAPNGQVEWWYHVAPLITVRQLDGSLVDMVFDPSIMSRPAPVADWQRLQTPDRCRQIRQGSHPNTHDCVFYFTERFNYMPEDADNPRTSWALDSIEDSNTTMATNLRVAHERQRARGFTPLRSPPSVQGVPH